MISKLIEREMERSALPVRRGVMLVVVGPSGVGKDTLIKAAKAHFADNDDVLFVRRAITRPEDRDGEDHLVIARDRFEEVRGTGGFAVSWEAHGLHYGVPVSVDAHLAGGGVAVVNGSRAALSLFAAHYLNLMVVNVTAKPEVLAQRLAARGRESAAVIRARIARSEDPRLASLPADAITVDNSGDLDLAARGLIDMIEKALARSSVADVL